MHKPGRGNVFFSQPRKGQAFECNCISCLRTHNRWGRTCAGWEATPHPSPGERNIHGLRGHQTNPGPGGQEGEQEGEEEKEDRGTIAEAAEGPSLGRSFEALIPERGSCTGYNRGTQKRERIVKGTINHNRREGYP